MLIPKNIPPHIGYYLAGFADGEGSFNISFRKRKDNRMPWKVSACFHISHKDRVILSLYKRYLQCGTLRERRDGVVYFEVNNLNAIKQNVIPFFKHFRFLSAKKKRDFSKFINIVQLIDNQEHVILDGMKKLLSIRRDMNDGGKRKFSEKEILRAFSSNESSETERRTALENTVE